MTPAAAETISVLTAVTGRHLVTRPTANGGCTFHGAANRYHGTVRPNGECDVFDAVDGGAGVPVRLVLNGEWSLVR